MTSLPPRVRVWTLVREELRALPRATFGLGAVGVVLLLAIPILVFGGDGASGIGETHLPLVLILQLAVAILLAARVAGARQSRFIDSLYTTPLTQGTWLAGQTVVGLVLALLMLLPLVPFLLLHIAFVGMPSVLPGFLVAVVGMAAFVVALGIFCGIVIGEAGTSAGTGLAGGCPFSFSSCS
jgi:hypothetical protein